VPIWANLCRCQQCTACQALDTCFCSTSVYVVHRHTHSEDNRMVCIRACCRARAPLHLCSCANHAVAIARAKATLPAPIIPSTHNICVLHIPQTRHGNSTYRRGKQVHLYTIMHTYVYSHMPLHCHKQGSRCLHLHAYLLTSSHTKHTACATLRLKQDLKAFPHAHGGSGSATTQVKGTSTPGDSALCKTCQGMLHHLPTPST
jgi:hypothetical protein